MINVAGNSGVVTVTLPTGLNWVTTGGFSSSGDPFTNTGTLAFASATSLTYTFPNASDVNAPGTSGPLKIIATAYVTTGATRGGAMNVTASIVNSGGTVNAAALQTKDVEPALTVATTFTPTTAAGGDTVLITITVTNDNSASSTNAYNTVLTDVLPSPDLAISSFVSTQSGWTAGAAAGTSPTPTRTRRVSRRERWRPSRST